MSHTQYAAARQRLQRSELAVPGSNPAMFEKAANSNADYVLLDLEDAVSPGEKLQARKNIIEALNDIDWRAQGKTISVRINSLDTHYMYRDVVDVVEQAGDRLDTILIPKVGVAADVYMVDAMLTQIETARGFTNRIGIEALIEITLGMANVDAIATSSPRMEAMHFGVADYAASCRARTTTIGGLNPDYPGDQWHHGSVAHAGGLPRLWFACDRWSFRRLQRSDGYLDAARRGAAMGYEGKWAIHPSQIDLANEVFSPPTPKSSVRSVFWRPSNRPQREGKGAAQLDGRMIDAASARMAENIVNYRRGHQGQTVTPGAAGGERWIFMNTRRRCCWQAACEGRDRLPSRTGRLVC